MKPMLKQSGIDQEVEIEVEGDRLIMRAAPKIRVGWDEAFAAMAAQQDDILLDDVSTTNWDRVEWEW